MLWYGEEETELDDDGDQALPVSSFLEPLDLSEVLSGQLFLSDRYIAQHLGVLARHKITHVLTLSRVPTLPLALSSARTPRAI